MRYALVPAPVCCAVLLLLSTLAAPAAGEEMYSYVDANGVYHYTNAPSDGRYKPTEKPARASRQSVTSVRRQSARAFAASPSLSVRVSNEERLLRTIASRSSAARARSEAATRDRFFFDEYASGLRGRGRLPVRVLRGGAYGDSGFAQGYAYGGGYGGAGHDGGFRSRGNTSFLSNYTRPARGYGFSDYIARRYSYPATPEHIDEHIRQAARTYGLDPMLIKAVIKTESNFNVNALSPKGARGLMQLMPGTARDMNVRNAFDPRDNIFGGARYLRMMLDQFGGDVALSLAAYNAGPNRVAATWTIPNIAETKNYVVKVMRHYHAYKGGAEARRPERPRLNALTRVFARNAEDDRGAFRTAARPSSIRVNNMVTTQ